MKTLKKQIMILIFMLNCVIGFAQLQLSNTFNIFPLITYENINDTNHILIDNGDINFNLNNLLLFESDSVQGTITDVIIRIDGGTPINITDTDIFPITLIYGQHIIILQITGNTVKTKKLYINVIDNTPSTGISDLAKVKPELRAYPNPTINELFVKFNTDKEKEKIEIFDIQGRLVYSDNEDREKGENTVRIEIVPVSTGIYFVRVAGETMKLIKQ